MRKYYSQNKCYSNGLHDMDSSRKVGYFVTSTKLYCINKVHSGYNGVWTLVRI